MRVWRAIRWRIRWVLQALRIVKPRTLTAEDINAWLRKCAEDERTQGVVTPPMLGKGFTPTATHSWITEDE